MSKPLCWIHTGLHKTGTTALQRTFSQNRSNLSKAGFLYPDLRPIKSRPAEAHHLLFRRLGVACEGFSEADCKTLCAIWLKQCTENKSSLLLSAESLSRYPTTIEALDWEWPDKRRRFLEGVADLLQEYRVVPIVVLRRQDEFIESFYKEWVLKRHENSHLRFEDFIRVSAPFYLRFEDNITLMKSIFGEVRVLSYHALKGGDLARNFFQALGSDVELESPTPHIRPSLSTQMTEIKRCLNSVSHPCADPKNFSKLAGCHAYQEWLQRPGRNLGSSESNLWASSDARRAFIDSFEQENARIARDYFGDGNRFPEYIETSSSNYMEALQLTKGDYRELATFVSDSGIDQSALR
jgi:hypothetical protein